MDTEEVVIKLNLDGHGVAKGAQTMQEAIGHAGDHVQEHFIHAENQGRAFKKLLHEISDVSPLIGAGFRLLSDPLSGLMYTMTNGLKAVHKAFEEFEKSMEKMAEAEAKRETARQEAKTKTLDILAKQKEAHEEFEKKLETAGKSGEAKSQHQEKLDAAREAAGGETAEYFAAKKTLDLEEKARIESELAAAKGRDQSVERAQSDSARIEAGEKLKARLKEIVKLEEEAQKKAILKEEGQGKGTRFLKGLVGNILTPGGVAIAEQQAAEKQAEEAAEAAKKYNDIKERRIDIEKTLREQDALDRQRSTEQKEAQGALLKGPEEIARLNKEIAADERKMNEKKREEESLKRKEDLAERVAEIQAEAGDNKVLALQETISAKETALEEARAADDKKQALELERELRKDNLALRKAEKEQAREQARFDRDFPIAQRKRREAERSPFMPTLKELSESMPWQRDLMDEAQRRQDAMTMRSGMAYGQKFAGDAQSLERLKDDAKRALFVEGPESSRFKEDIKKMDTLKKGLAAAGLQTSEDRLESMDKNIAEMLDKATREGLVVQPVNGN